MCLSFEARKVKYTVTVRSTKIDKQLYGEKQCAEINPNECGRHEKKKYWHDNSLEDCSAIKSIV